MKMNTFNVMNNKGLIGFIKTFLSLNEIAVSLVLVSKIWQNTLSSTSELVLQNSTNSIFIGATRHINCSLLTHINIAIKPVSFRDSYLNAIPILTKTIIEFFANLKTKKLCSISIYYPHYNGIHNLENLNTPKEMPCTNEELNRVSHIVHHTFHYCVLCYYYNCQKLLDIYVDPSLYYIMRDQNYCDKISQWLAQSKIQRIDISGNNKLTISGIEHLFCMKETNLYYLNLGKCHLLTDKTLKYIATCLNGTQLKHFGAHNCFIITNDDLEQLILAIRETNLIFFEISNCSLIENVSIDSKKMNKKLEYLNLYSCEELTCVGLKILLEGLNETNIVSLNLCDANITDKTMHILIEKLRGTNMRHLNLGNSSLSDSNLCVIMDALKYNDFISFDLSGIQIQLTNDNMATLLMIINNS